MSWWIIEDSKTPLHRKTQKLFWNSDIIYAIHIYYVYMLCIFAIHICYVYLLCTFAMYICYVYLLCIFAMYICYVYLLMYHKFSQQFLTSTSFNGSSIKGRWNWKPLTVHHNHLLQQHLLNKTLVIWKVKKVYNNFIKRYVNYGI